MPIELIVALAVVAVAAVGYVIYQRRDRPLPPAPSPKELQPKAEPARDDEPRAKPKPAAEPEREAEPPARADEPETVPEEPETAPLGAERASPTPARADEAKVPTKRDAPLVPPPPTLSSQVPMPVEKPKAAAGDDDHQQAQRLSERERYRKGLEKTRGGFVARLARLFKGKPKVDADLHEQVEEVLFNADIGAATANKLLAKVTDVLDKKEVADADAVWAVIRQASLELLEIPSDAPNFEPEVKPYVLLMIGVNGVGKTTTLGKLASRHAEAGRKVLLVAGDTFRAAAVEQLDVWARRVGCELHTGEDKADPSSVIFDGIARGREGGFDVVLCDTAGRLHTRKELMDELAKVRRASTKAIAQALPQDERDSVLGPHDTYLVLDATIGQNALAQAQMFKETMDFTGLIVTKLDGTAKGGVVLGICGEMKIPIRYIGIGEGIDDLREFSPEDFADALLVDRDREAAQ